ncbi:MAG: class IV adenylate cyclase [Candidatus Woesearchaeota archaeon]
MKEVEILVKVIDDKEKALSLLKRFEPEGIRVIHDVYYKHPAGLVQFVKEPRSWLRVRTQEGRSFVTFKKDVFKGKEWIYSDEHETEVKDAELMNKILEELGFQELITLHNERNVFKQDDYEIVLEDVKDLGLFLEVELKREPEDAEKAKSQIQKFISELGLKTEDVKEGKPGMLLKKNNLL